MFYYGVKKDFQGNVDKSTFFSTPGLIINTFGYYRNDEETWIVFVTDDERGTEIKRKKLPTEEAAIEYLIEFCDSQNFAHYSNTVMENFEEKEPTIIEHLKTEYGYSDAKAQKALDYLLQVKIIAFEFSYFVENGNYVPDKYASVFSGYTAKRISTETDLTILGAFNYMVFLKRNPDEALSNLKKGLPKRKIYTDKDLEEVQKTMDEKDTALVESAEQITEKSTTNGDKLFLPEEQPNHYEFDEIKEDLLCIRLNAVQQALATLQQAFDDKIAEDTHKNGLFDNMHRELVRYQNGALDKIVDTIALDIIQLVDTTKGHVRVYEKKEPTEENYKKLLRIVKGIAEDLEDILYRQNIESYRVPSHEVDVRRQKIIQTIPTDDKSKDNLVAVRAADGYEKGDKVLRPERIKIFKYEATPETPSEN